MNTIHCNGCNGPIPATQKRLSFKPEVSVGCTFRAAEEDVDVCQACIEKNPLLKVVWRGIRRWEIR